MNTYHIIYKRLLALGIHADSGADSRRSLSGGFMDLVVERLHHLDADIPDQPGLVYSMAHYFEQNGDLCSDPEMTLIVYPERESAEALSYQQAIPPMYQVVYPAEGSVITAHKRELNSFLKTWLNTLRVQGHGKRWITT